MYRSSFLTTDKLKGNILNFLTILKQKFTTTHQQIPNCTARKAQKVTLTTPQRATPQNHPSGSLGREPTLFPAEEHHPYNNNHTAIEKFIYGEMCAKRQVVTPPTRIGRHTDARFFSAALLIPSSDTKMYASHTNACS